MPSLRERPEDIPLLVEHFYKKFVQPPYTAEIITGEALKSLVSYDFPGNIRELENVVERCLILGGKTIAKDYLPVHITNYSASVTCGAHAASLRRTQS